MQRHSHRNDGEKKQTPFIWGVVVGLAAPLPVVHNILHTQFSRDREKKLRFFLRSCPPRRTCGSTSAATKAQRVSRLLFDPGGTAARACFSFLVANHICRSRCTAQS